MALNAYESDESERQCESDRGFECLWRKVVALNA